MFRGKEVRQWWHTAHLMAAVLNSQRGKGQRAVTPRELHPYMTHGAGGTPVDRTNIGSLLAAFQVTAEKQRAAMAKAEAAKEATQAAVNEWRQRLEVAECST
jgi:hypothetical protein